MTPASHFHICFSVGSAGGSVRLFLFIEPLTTSCGIYQDLGHEKEDANEHVQKHAPGTREFNSWIVRSACLRSVMEVHRKDCPICQGG
jgi:hypothetical protein